MTWRGLGGFEERQRGNGEDAGRHSCDLGRCTGSMIRTCKTGCVQGSKQIPARPQTATARAVQVEMHSSEAVKLAVPEECDASVEEDDDAFCDAQRGCL